MNNEFENNMNETQFDDMRQQLKTLKKKLSEQDIINDRLIRRSMKNTAGQINRKYTIAMILGLLMIPYTYWVFTKLSGFTVAFWLFTCVFMLICVGATYYNSRNITDANLMTNNLLDVRRRMARAKKFDANWLYFGVPGVLLFLGWFMYEIYLQDLSGVAALAVSSEPLLDSSFTSRPSVSIKKSSTRLKISPLTNSDDDATIGCQMERSAVVNLADDVNRIT